MIRISKHHADLIEEVLFPLLGDSDKKTYIAFYNQTFQDGMGIFEIGGVRVLCPDTQRGSSVHKLTKARIEATRALKEGRAKIIPDRTKDDRVNLDHLCAACGNNEGNDCRINNILKELV